MQQIKTSWLKVSLWKGQKIFIRTSLRETAAPNALLDQPENLIVEHEEGKARIKGALLPNPIS